MKISIEEIDYPWRVTIGESKIDFQIFEKRCYEWLDANIPETEWTGAERCRYLNRHPPLYVGSGSFNIYFKTEHDALMFKLAFE